MASVQKRPNGKWRARYRDEANREHARHFARKVDAQQWLDDQTAALVRGDWVDPANSKKLLRTYAEDWRAVQVTSAGTARINDNALRLHLLPALGDRMIGSIRPSEIQAFVKSLDVEKSLAPGTVRNIFDVTRIVFAAAVEDRVIRQTPCRKIKLPAGESTDEVAVPTRAEIEAVCAALDERWRPIPIILAGTGLRVAELLGLRPDDLSPTFRTLVVERQRRQDNTIGPLKTRRNGKPARRVIPVGDVAVSAFETFAATAVVSDEAAFVDEFGKPLTYTRWKKLLKTATADAGVDLTSHSLRHFAASELLSRGASIKQVQEFLGHSSPTITLRVYAHLVPGDEDRTRDALDAALSPLADSLRTEAASNG